MKMEESLEKNYIKLIYQVTLHVQIYTGWGKTPSVFSVGHCEGRGGHRRMGLGSKVAGSWEVPVTTLRSRIDGVVQRAARICCQNLLFAVTLL